MSKYKYNLSYIDNGIIKSIDLQLFSTLSKKDLHEIKNIDELTTIYNSEEELLDNLKFLNLIPNNINKLYLTHNVNGEEIIGYNGDILLFKKDKEKLDIRYIKNVFENYKEEPNKLLILARQYLKKYNKSKGMMLKVKDLIFYANLKRESSFNYLCSDEIEELNGTIDNFINTEFYDKTKQDKTIRYSNIRDFVIKEKYVEAEYNISRLHDYLKYNNNILKSNIKKDDLINEENIEDDNEEFLTMADFDKVDNSILDGYHEDFEIYQDGKDYIVPITKKELKKALDDIGKKLSLKPGDGDLK